MGGQGTVTSKLNLNFVFAFAYQKFVIFKSMAKVLYGKVKITNFSSIMKRCSSIFWAKNADF